ncbi:pesticidal protein, partial [Bacillus mycoides]
HFQTFENEQQTIETIQNQTNDLFIDYTKNTLKTEVTDYQIDQTATTIESISEKQYPQEKMILLDEIKHAKQLSYSRNLLQNGDFQDLIGWTINNDVTVQTKNPVFKASSLYMPGARTIDTTVFPNYIYQKIDESKLKPYTRYLVRGFIESSKDLEVYITRYNKEIDTIMNVPNDFISIQPYDQIDYTTTQISPNLTTSHNSCTCESTRLP